MNNGSRLRLIFMGGGHSATQKQSEKVHNLVMYFSFPLPICTLGRQTATRSETAALPLPLVEFTCLFYPFFSSRHASKMLLERALSPFLWQWIRRWCVAFAGKHWKGKGAAGLQTMRVGGWGGSLCNDTADYMWKIKQPPQQTAGKLRRRTSMFSSYSCVFKAFKN